MTLGRRMLLAGITLGEVARSAGVPSSAIAGALMLISMSACSLTGGPLQGVVLDKSTNQPIAGAIVVARWHGHWTNLLAGSSSACYHIETARTDANGRYAIPAWTRPPKPLEDFRFSDGGNDTAVFKPGYVDLSGGAGGTMYMEPFVGTNDEYFAKVLTYLRWLCTSPSDSAKNLYRVFKAAAADAKARAVTTEQVSRALSLEHLAEESLTDMAKPTTYRGGNLVNVDPGDKLKAEE
jgi:hypothetical protein